MKRWFLTILALFSLSCRGEKYELGEMPIGIPAGTELVSQDGRRESLLQGNGATALFFGFTRCPDFCPMTLGKIDAAVKDGKLEQKLRLVFVSVDTPREKPEDLKRFLSSFPYARGFSGTKAEIAALEKSLGAFSKDDAGKISHSLYIYVLNAKGKAVYLLRHDDPTAKIRAVLEQAAS